MSHKILIVCFLCVVPQKSELGGEGVPVAGTALHGAQSDHHLVYFSTADQIKQTLPPDRVFELPSSLSRPGLLRRTFWTYRTGVWTQGQLRLSCVETTEHRGRMWVLGRRAVAPLIIRPAGGGGVSPRRCSEQPARLFLNMSRTRRSTLNPRQDKFTAK